ncbi:hypothetical protein [uncultured Hymenobacter sp.]|uniref:hypothetical protein n=1 Tax=uncultured Hymenobacter sp. TaxID=170016 RepID=UPI0035CB67FD
MENPLEEVIEWLEAGEAADYRAGVRLLEAHGRNRSLVSQLQRKESANNHEKLRYELVKIGCGGRLADVSEVLSHFAQAVQKAVPAALASLAVAALTQPEEPAPGVEQVPEAARGQVEDLTRLMQQVYNQRCQLSNTLGELPEGEGPRVVAEILSLQNQYNALSGKRRSLLAGEPVAELPTPPAAGDVAAAPADRADLLQKRGNLRSQVSKAKAAAAKHPDDALKAEKVAKLLVELDVLETQIKQLPA